MEGNLTGDLLVCLDTNILIDFMRGDKKVIDLVNSYSLKEIISITAITEYELLKHGDKIKREVAEEVIGPMKIHYFDRISAAEAARIFNRLKDAGKMINENDILIAGIAIANNELLITKDGRFKDIKSEKILVI